MAQKKIQITETTVTTHLVNEEDLAGVDLDDDMAVLAYVEEALLDVDIAGCHDYAVTEREAAIADV